jgi:hypothetical protein
MLGDESKILDAPGTLTFSGTTRKNPSPVYPVSSTGQALYEREMPIPRKRPASNYWIPIYIVMV